MKESSLLLYKRLIMFALLACFPLNSAQAGYLTINGSSTITVSQKDGKIALSGTYSIENKGTETARAVYPSFSMASWVWAGEPRDLERGTSSDWKIEAEIPTAKITCAVDPLCAGESFAERGLFPLLVTRHYQDTNGYKFSAAEVIALTIGALEQSEIVATRSQPIEATLAIEGDGQDFDALLQIRNVSNQPLTVAAGLHGSRQLQLLTEPKTISIEAGQIARSEFQIKNFSGLAGSNYATFAVLQWQQDQMRNMLAVSALTSVATAKKNDQFALLAVGASIFLAMLLYIFVFRQKD